MDYLNFLPVWIRLWNIPVNYYTKETIKELASVVGPVLEVNFDAEKSQNLTRNVVFIIFS